MNNNIQKLVRTSLLLAVAIVIQVLGKNLPQVNQFLVGPSINAILLLVEFFCGTIWGVSIAALTPVLAWLTGQLPTALAPFIPFVIIGNIIFVLLFSILKDYKYNGKYLGIALGSLLKYLFLSLSASKLVHAFKLGIPDKIANKLIIMMGIPQLVTALIGGLIALLLIEILQKRKIR